MYSMSKKYKTIKTILTYDNFSFKFISNLELSFIREREHFLEIFKKKEDDIILPWVADGVSMYWWVPIS